MKFKSENQVTSMIDWTLGISILSLLLQVLSQYIDNLMASSSTFQGTSPREFPK